MEIGRIRTDEERDREEEFFHRRDAGIVAARERMVLPSPLLMALARRVGKAEARKVVDFVASWVAATVAAGHPATAVEFASFWGVGEATAYRDLRAFKAAFPTEANPERLAWVLGWADAPWITHEEFERIQHELLLDFAD